MTASVNFEVKYSSPENNDGNFDSPTVSKFVHQASLEEDQQMLLDIERNIANLERSLNQGLINHLLMFSQLKFNHIFFYPFSFRFRT